jgi:phosphatidylglycerophosphate synthase
MAAAFAMTRGLWWTAAILVQVRLLCNLLDGMVAVEGGLGTRSGEVYNELPDRVSDTIILVAAGYSIGQAELGWAAAVVALLTAYIRALGGACGLPQDFGGPMAKPQRMAVVTAACVVARFDVRAMDVGLIVVVAGSLLTAGLRTWRLVRGLEGRR